MVNKKQVLRINCLAACAMLWFCAASSQAQDSNSPYGTLRIKSPCLAAAHIDGAAAYLVMPSRVLQLKRVSPGSHKIRFISGSRQWMKQVQIAAGQTLTINANLPAESYRPQMQTSTRYTPPAVKLHKTYTPPQAIPRDTIDADIEKRMMQKMEREESRTAPARRQYTPPPPRRSTPRYHRKKHKIHRPKVH